MEQRSGAHPRLSRAMIRDRVLPFACFVGLIVIAANGGFRLSASLTSRYPTGTLTSSSSAVTRGAGNGGAASLAYQQSFGFFHDIPDGDWTRKQERARNHRHQASAADKAVTQGLEANRWYMKNYYPLFTCPDQQRVGVGGDGPKWACDPYRLALPRKNPSDKCLVYSIGCSGNYLFEDGLVDLLGAGTCEIHVFDMSRDYTRPVNTARDIFFHHWGLSSSYSTVGRMEGHTYLTLQETMEKLGHVNRTIDVFKIDCENCEWTTYKDWIGDSVDIRQLLIETHGIPTELGVNPPDFFEDIEKAGYAMFSKEANIHPVVGGKCVEWGYLKLRKEFFGDRFA